MDENRTMICPSCGTELPEGTPFCHECGLRLDTVIPDAPADIVTEETAPAAEELASEPAGTEEIVPAESVIPEAETVTESKQDRRAREKAEKEAAKAQAKADEAAAKAQAKADKVAAKAAAKAARRAERRKRNIWAIFLMVIFFAGMCYIGWEYIGQRQENKELQAVNAGLEQDIAGLKEDVEEREKTIAENEETYAAAEDEHADAVKDLNDKLDACQDKIDELQKTVEKVQEKADQADELIEALDSENIGYASETLFANHGIVVMKRSSKGYDVVITSKGGYEIECVSGTSAEAAVSESNEDVVIFSPKEYGVSVFKVTGKDDVLHIVVIVE